MGTSSALKHVSTSTSPCACLWYEHHYSFCVFGVEVQMKSVSPNNSQNTSCIHKGLHAGTWPDPMTSKPDSFSTLRYHWTDHTGRRLEPQVHWDATGTTLADASTQWCPSGDPVLICIIGKTPVRIILWCPITKMLIKACFLVQPLEQEGVYQKCCISLYSKVFINHFYQMKASPECLNILTYCRTYWVDRLKRTIGRKV